MLSSLLKSSKAAMTCCQMGERQLGTYIYMFTVMTLNTYLQGLPSHHQCRGYIYIYIYIYIYAIKKENYQKRVKDFISSTFLIP